MTTVVIHTRDRKTFVHVNDAGYNGFVSAIKYKDKIHFHPEGDDSHYDIASRLFKKHNIPEHKQDSEFENHMTIGMYHPGKKQFKDLSVPDRPAAMKSPQGKIFMKKPKLKNFEPSGN